MCNNCGLGNLADGIVIKKQSWKDLDSLENLTVVNYVFCHCSFGVNLRKEFDIICSLLDLPRFTSFNIRNVPTKDFKLCAENVVMLSSQSI